MCHPTHTRKHPRALAAYEGRTTRLSAEGARRPGSHFPWWLLWLL